MNIEQSLIDRSNNSCELCNSKENLAIHLVAPAKEETEKDTIYICNTCSSQIEDELPIEPNHWRCLNESMWSEIPAVQVVAWRMLTRMSTEGWPADLLEMLYLSDEVLEWAKVTGEGQEENKLVHKDSNGATLHNGDSVTLTKDLNVKGSSMVAKRGTAVRNITLVYDNQEQIEGKVNGQQIVILTQFVKKST